MVAFEINRCGLEVLLAALNPTYRMEKASTVTENSDFTASPETPAEPAPGVVRSEPKPPLSRQIWRVWVRPVVFVLIAVSTFRSTVADWNDVPTGSMKPTILEGERIFVNKLAYDLKVPFTRVRLAQWDDPERGDVVVLFSPADGRRLVKRVIGLPGDEISMRHNRLYIDGEEAEYEPFEPEDLKEIAFHPEPTAQVLHESIGDLVHPVMWFPYAAWGTAFRRLTVPEGNFFVMGDNRNQSKDSRAFGFVERERIVGQATAVVTSLDKERHRRPRWARFFQGLR